MTINARYPGKCAACGGAIAAGDKIEWEKGQKARHVECPASDVLLNAAYQPKGATARSNRKAAHCTFCGEPLAIGAGNLWWGEDGCCSDPHHFDDGGWHVTCPDRDACEARVHVARDAAKVAAAKATVERVAKKARELAEAEAFAIRKAEILAGLEQCTVALPAGAVRGEVLATHDGTELTAYVLADEVRVVYETWYAYDDSRAYVHAPPALARELRLAHAAKYGITADAAREWLVQYGGCEGADVRRAVVEHAAKA